jgi:outer membrane protein TolC/ABC-type uncharacterized transport system substrate-binding protein
MAQGIREELTMLSARYYEVNVLPDQTAECDASRVKALLAENLKNDKVDILLVSGPLFTQAVKKQMPLSKPVIIASLLNPEIAGLPQTAEGTSGVTNLYYTAKTSYIDDDLKYFSRIAQFDKVHVLIPDGLKEYAEKVRAKLQEQNIQADLISGAGSVTQILERIDAAQVKALYLTPLDLSREDRKTLVNEINKRGIPTFSYVGHEDVEAGVLASRMPKLLVQFTRRIAIAIDRIIKGEDAGSIPVRFEIEDKLVVNQRTANQIGISLPFDVLMEAEVLFRDDVQGGELTMQQAVAAALENNLNFRIYDEKIKAVGKEYWLAWSSYLPLIEGRLDYGWYDYNDRRYRETQPEEDFEAGITLNQLIFSHPVLRSIMNAKKQVTIEKLNKDTMSLDITAQTVVAYLNYLRTKALFRVEQENLKAITENLAVAQRRNQAGMVGKEEVLRWEAELADKKSLILTRESVVFRARVILNQLMNRQQEEFFEEQDVGLETLKYYIGGQTMDPYVNDLATMKVFLEFSVQQAMNDSPELKALQVGIEQQRNRVKSADGKFILPEVSMDSGAYESLDEQYDDFSRPGDEDRWDTKVSMTYPLFDRGRRPLNSMRERDILRQLEYSMALKKQEIERDLRLAAYDIYTSLPSIELKRQAMVSSSEEYQITELKYNEGLISYVDLINIQAVKFQREANAVIAMYDFFDSLSRFDRQVATFMMLTPEEERQAWLTEAREYLDSKGV